MGASEEPPSGPGMRGSRLLARGREETAALCIYPVLWQTGITTVPLLFGLVQGQGWVWAEGKRANREGSSSPPPPPHSKVEKGTRPQVKPPEILRGGSRKEESK